jgi:hypothetical protein
LLGSLLTVGKAVALDGSGDIVGDIVDPFTGVLFTADESDCIIFTAFADGLLGFKLNIGDALVFISLGLLLTEGKEVDKEGSGVILGNFVGPWNGWLDTVGIVVGIKLI